MKLVVDGFVLLVLGQAMVFLFLALMVSMITATAWAVNRFAATAATSFPGIAPIAPEAADDAVTAAVAVAVQQFRANS